MGRNMILYICTAARGGMRSVLDGYRDSGLFERWDAQVVWSHREGSVFQRMLTALSAVFRVFWLVSLGKVKLMHCHAAMRGSFWRKALFAKIAHLYGVPVVFHLHGSEFKSFYANQGQLGKRIIRNTFAAADVVIVLSPSWAEFVRTIAPRANTRVLPNFVKISRTNEADRFEVSRPAENGSVTALFLGLVGDRKGVFDLLPALKAARQHAPNLKLIIGGNGEVSRAEETALTLGVSDAVHFAGWVSGDEKNDLLKRADFFVLPSHNEGLPVSLLEAMSHGLPVISTKVGGIPELVTHEQDGILIDAGDVLALTEALIKLAKGDSLRNRMSQAGREKVQKFYSVDAVLPELEGIYRGLLAMPNLR